MTSVAVAGRADLTDAQWAQLEPLLPRGKKAGRPPMWTKRQLIDGIRWRTRVGCPWRDVPVAYGSWRAVYGLFRRWQRAGVWAMILKSLQVLANAAGEIVWQVSVDSTNARAHQHAAGARREGSRQAEPPHGPGECEPSDHGLGRSRGGWTSKLHLATEQGCRVLSVLVTAGQVGDSPQFTTVLDAIEVPRLGGGRARVRPERVLADKAYSARANRDWLRRHGIKATIPIPADQAGHRHRRGSAGGRPPAFDPAIYRDRNAVERGLATIHIAVINQWLRHQ
ncbi:IS5 family transposase [Nocardia sp. NBC_01009]|uniref:IS5 family transposase n=1 Tax=Nocardia sp. NBC_01009 TaxID=2975996 RepID=UPI003865AF4B|nr:IS5 family transposase [Nocardia sp. NBC_01009]